MSRIVKILVSAILVIVFASFSLSAMAVGETQQNHYCMFKPTDEYITQVWSSDADGCTTVLEQKYICTNSWCGKFVYVSVEGTSRSGPHDYIFIQVTQMQGYYACKYCDRYRTPGIYPGV